MILLLRSRHACAASGSLRRERQARHPLVSRTGSVRVGNRVASIMTQPYRQIG